jgi:hypothetical protein
MTTLILDILCHIQGGYHESASEIMRLYGAFSSGRRFARLETERQEFQT